MEKTAREYSDGAGRLDVPPYLRRAIVVVAIAAAAALLVLFLRQVGRVLLAGFAGVLFAIFLRRLSVAVARYTPLGNRAALVLVVVVLLAAFGLGAWLLAPSISADTQSLVDTIPRALTDLRERVRTWPLGDRIASALSGSGQDLFGQMTSMATNLVSYLFTFATFAFVIAGTGLYIAYSPRLHSGGLVRLMPPDKRHRTAQILLELRNILSWWIFGRIFSLFLVGAMTTLGLWLLGVPSPFALGALAGVLSFIPNFGPVLSVIPAILVALTESTNLALYTALLYAGIQFVESGFITPIVQRKAVEVPPAIILFTQVLLGFVFGVLGLLLATPLAVTVMVLVQRLYIEEYLGESPDADVRAFDPTA